VIGFEQKHQTKKINIIFKLNQFLADTPNPEEIQS
jgi:hypothetical protein